MPGRGRRGGRTTPTRRSPLGVTGAGTDDESAVGLEVQSLSDHPTGQHEPVGQGEEVVPPAAAGQHLDRVREPTVDVLQVQEGLVAPVSRVDVQDDEAGG